MNEFRNKEFPQLNKKIYLDYAGALPVSKSQVNRFSFLAEECITNPHSASQVSRSLNETDALRVEILNHLKTSPDEYVIAFTHNTTTAAQTIVNLLNLEKIKDFHSFYYLVDNHNSIVGISSILKQRKNDIEIKCVDSYEKCSLFAFPMVSNFNGKKYPMEWIETAQRNNGLVIFDAAATSCCDLSKYKPDFVILSLLKLYGAHGGALLIRRDRIQFLNDPPPAGGNLLYSCSRTNLFKLMPSITKKIECGTLAYTDLMLALEGLRTRQSFGSEDFINEHLTNLSHYFYQEMSSLKHKNGKNVVHFYQDSFDYPNFAFNILKDDGNVVNHHEVLFTMSAHNVDIRSGSHCNPGATFTNLNWTTKDVVAMGENSNLSDKCMSALCIVDGRPVSTLRVSLGYPTLKSDIDKFVSIVSKVFCNGGPNPDPLSKKVVLPLTLTRIFVTPVVGCRGFEVKESKFTKYGLKYDRNWRLFDEDGKPITPPRCFGVTSLTATINEEEKTLILNIENTRGNIQESYSVPIQGFQENQNAPEQVKSFGQVYSNEVSNFIRKAIGRHAYLVKIQENKLGKFAFSCVTEESEKALCPDFDIERWYSNFVFSGAPAFSEEGEKLPNMKLSKWKISLWRWRIVCMTSSVVPGLDNVDRSMPQTLVDSRSNYGTSPFGILFCVDCDGFNEDELILRVGDQLTTE